MDRSVTSAGGVPHGLRPMLAVAGSLPADERGWGFELKWDGLRALATIEDGGLRLTSRNGRDITVSYPELQPLAAALTGHRAVVDGEIVAFAGGRPDFGLLQQRMHVTDAGRARRLAQRVPVTLVVFDLLFLDGRLTVPLPYLQRRRLLQTLQLQGSHWSTPACFEAGGGALLQAAADQGLEGVVAKRLDAPYQPGRRSSAFVKVKLLRTQEVVVGGFTPGQGRRRGGLGALLVGVPDGDGRLRYVGKVGTGFTDETRGELVRRVAALRREDSPFASPLPRGQAAAATWVAPTLVGEVSFSQWTAERRLRQPSWRGLRPDKEPGDVAIET